MNRKKWDIFYKYLFRTVSLFSVLALGAILLFVFAQGIIPFVTPTSKCVRLVPQNISELTVNGETYVDHSGFINLPNDAASISIRFSAGSMFDFGDEEGWDWDWDDDDEEFFNDEDNLVMGEDTANELALTDDTIFDSGESDEILEIIIDPAEKDPEKKITFINNTGEISYPEAYVCTVSWPGMIAAMEKKIHIILPEPPYNPVKFLSGLEWQPIREKLFGIFPMIAGTLLASLGAILLGVPVALLCAVFLSEFLGDKPAAVVRSGIELLAGIPSVVYGFFGLMVIVPAVKSIFHVPAGNTLLSAIIVLALMILPTVITIAETSLRAVPLSLREASLSLGASKMQTSWRVVLPHAQSGVIAGIILGISRAVGETMAVILVAGNSPHLTLNPLESVRTLTATIAMEMGYASGRHSEILFSIGVVLFIIILFLNSLILAFRRRMEEA
jgi:phosphate transport system permease protein